MQSFNDPIYKKCCAALRQQLQKSDKEVEFCHWLSAEFGVPVPIFITADKPHDQNRLLIIFHIKDENETFFIQTDEYYGRDKEKQQAILTKAQDLAILENTEVFDWGNYLEKRKRWWQKRKKPALNDGNVEPERTKWFVSYAAFAPVALSEATSNVPKEKVKLLAREFSTVGVWRIERFFDCAIVMFNTESKRLLAQKNGVNEQIQKAWQQLLRPYDEFGILEHVSPRTKFDSKEVFDRDYNSSWMAYFR